MCVKLLMHSSPKYQSLKLLLHSFTQIPYVSPVSITLFTNYQSLKLLLHSSPKYQMCLKLLLHSLPKYVSQVAIAFFTQIPSVSHVAIALLIQISRVSSCYCIISPMLKSQVVTAFLPKC